jgi:hypothetical protein
MHFRSRITPFAFGEIGDVRLSSPGAVSNNFGFVAGVGANIKLASRVSLQLIPADYILVDAPAGPTHSHAAQVGIVINLWQRKK